jgi:hypothetical protein
VSLGTFFIQESTAEDKIKLTFLLQGNMDTGVQKILSDTESTEVPPPINNLVLDHMLQLPGLDKEMILKVKSLSGVSCKVFHNFCL